MEVMRLDGIVCIFGTDDSTSGAAANIHGASADNENKDLRWQTRALCQVLTDEPGKSVVGDNELRAKKTCQWAAYLNSVLWII